MDLFRSAERLMGMNDAVWARHANPWSVYTRFTCLPLLVLAIYSRTWIGLWAVPLTALALFWIWYNPRAFAPARQWDTWAAHVTLGERIWIDRRQDVPAHHAAWARGLSLAAVPGALVMIWGLWHLAPAATVYGTLLTILPKVWFCDRMVWLYRDLNRL